jgi:fibronectin-binding autotransporter adhesin
LGNIPANTQIRNPLVFNAGTYVDGGNAAIRADSSGIELYGQLTANLSPVNMSSGGSGAVNALGQITGSNGLWLKTPGTAFTLTLSNITASANNYQGTTRIDPKTTLVLGKNEQIPHGISAGNVTNNGTFSLNGFSETINGLSGTGIVDGVSGTPTLTVGDNNATGVSNTFAGVITDTAGTLSLTKIGNGILYLNGINTHSGLTLVNAGTLGGTGTIGGAVSVAANANLAAGTATGTIGKLTLGGTLAMNDGGLTVDINGPGTAGVDYDQITVAGALTMTGVNTININVLGGFIQDGTYILMTFGTSAASTFKFPERDDDHDPVWRNPQSGQQHHEPAVDRIRCAEDIDLEG